MAAPRKATVQRQLERAAARALTYLGKEGATVHLFLLRSEPMRQLARDYLHKEKEVVDVLSFPEPATFPHPEAERLLGEIYLNWEVFKVDLPYLTFLMVHGLLHLLGYNHEAKRDTIAMEKLERELCKHITSQG